MNPRRASWAAVTAAWAAMPQCSRLTVPPVRLASMMPEAIDAVRPSAWRTPASSAPYSREAVTAPPIAPVIDVACWPCSKNTELPRSWS